MADQSLDLQTNSSEVDEHVRHEAEPNEEGVPCHVFVVVAEVAEDAVLDLGATAQMQDDEVGGVVRDAAGDQADENRHTPAGTESDLGEHETYASDHSIEQPDDGHPGADGSDDSVKKVNFFFAFGLITRILPIRNHFFN